MPDAWYRTRFPAEGGDAGEYMRPLTLPEIVGVVEYDVGGDRRRRGSLLEARSAFRRATHDFPAFAEAHASLGATLQLLGSLDEAETTYRAAKRANPALPDVDANLDLLIQERRGDGVWVSR